MLLSQRFCAFVIYPPQHGPKPPQSNETSHWHLGCSCPDSKIRKKIKRRKKNESLQNCIDGNGVGVGSHDLAKAESMDKDIVEVAASAGSFKTLIAAAQAAGLVEALKGQGPLTVIRADR